MSPLFAILFLGGALLLSSLLWLLLLLRQRNKHLVEREGLKSTIVDLEHKVHNQETMSTALEKTFLSISQKTLETNHSLFTKMAEGSLEKILSKAEGKWERKEDQINHIIEPVKEMLHRLEKQRQQMDSTHQKTHGNLEEQLRFLIRNNESLKKETNNLVNALKKPHVRGKWGELSLKRVVELSGMTAHCDFFEQPHLSNSKGIFRPDMIVHLPENRQIIIDAKVPLQGYLDNLEMETEKDKENCLLKHTRHVLSHMEKLSTKEYWNQFKNTPDFVVMFMPGESFFRTALQFEKDLIEKGIQKKVLIATPVTLIALLRSAAYGWQQNALAHNAEKISLLGTRLHERIVSFLSHYEKLGKALNTANHSFNNSISVLEKRVLVSARQFKELGVHTSKPIKTPETIEESLKTAPSIAESKRDSLPFEKKTCP